MFESIHALSSNEIPDSHKVTLTFYLQCLTRNRRYLFAYASHRLHHIRQSRWEIGSVLPEHLVPKLSSRENDYFMEYSNLLSDYCVSAGVDLSSDLEPPKNLRIEVRVLVDCGEIMTENGPVTLDKDTTHYLRRADVEHLIRQGQIEVVSSDN